VGPWTGVVLALAEPGSDGLRSRLSTYLHPLAGRPLAWHAVSCLAALRPAPARIVVVGGELAIELFGDIDCVVDVLPATEAALGGAVVAAEGRVLVVDAAAPTAGPALDPLLKRPDDVLLEGADGAVLAAWIGPEGAERLVTRGGDLSVLRALPGIDVVPDPAGFVVRDRATLARAGAAIRDRVVHRLMNEGVTFLLPQTVLVDVGVIIGRDSVIYPGCVLEGQTVVGDETVIGPCCRIITSRVGSGVELRGFNYVSHTAIRNRAILESHARRGFDDE
jgi:bifunctional N-acetylglucosamine-1-phosphate-uridyltransferase/glucosamine-1-phosphate-acetyltransferase GlmU-like protein